MSEPIRIRSYHPTTVEIDGQTLQVRIGRFSVGNLSEYSRLETAMSESREDRLLLVRRTPEELERITPTEADTDEHGALLARAEGLEARATTDGKDAFLLEVFSFVRSVVERLKPTERYRIPDDEIRRRRNQDLTPEQRVELAQYRQEEQDAYEAFLTFCIRDFVTIAPGQFEFEDEDSGDVTPITTGAQVLQFFGGRADLLRQLLHAVRRENLSTAEEKKAWRSRSASTRSSVARGPEADGPTPDGAATPAGTEDSAPSAAATASIEETSYGETGKASS